MDERGGRRPLFSVGTSQSTRLLEIGAIVLFLVLSVLSIASSAYEIAILFAIVAVIFIIIYFRMARFDFYEESLRIQRRNALLKEIQYSDVEDVYISKPSLTMPPRVSLTVKDDPKGLAWVGNPKNKELGVDLIAWLKEKVKSYRELR